MRKEKRERPVQNAGRARIRPSRSSAMPVAHQQIEDTTIRGDIDWPSYQALSPGIQVETTAGQRSRGQKARASGRTGTQVKKRKAKLAAALSSVQGRVVSRATNTSRHNVQRSKTGATARMGNAQRIRKRGGASHPCPLCAHATRVRRTTKVSTTVQRHRQCLHCHHEYLTIERRVT